MIAPITAACHCHTGKVRRNNEDNFFFARRFLPPENHGLSRAISARYMASCPSVSFGVFDGMGGEEDGQIASHLAAKTFWERLAARDENAAPPEVFLENVIQEMNLAVCRAAEENLEQMGSTAVMLHFTDGRVFACNLGDSRAFRLRQGELLQLSTDHVEVFPPQLGTVRRKPRLTQALGIPPEELLLEPSIVKEQAQPGDRYLLCSDGLTDMVAFEEIRAILGAAPDVVSCASRLVDAALQAGGRDNVTVITVEVEAAPPTGEAMNFE